MDIFYILNILIVIVGCMTIYCSIRLANVLMAIKPNIWWYVCPMLVIWGVGNRLLIVMFYGTPWVDEIAALNLPWWVGITIFIRQVRIATEKMVEKS